jgi:SH3-like domain-containing protein
MIKPIVSCVILWIAIFSSFIQISYADDKTPSKISAKEGKILVKDGKTGKISGEKKLNRPSSKSASSAISSSAKKTEISKSVTPIQASSKSASPTVAKSSSTEKTLKETSKDIILSKTENISSSDLTSQDQVDIVKDIDSIETTNQKLPIPRFVTLKSGQINVRTGPGMRYPIAWMYQCKQYPVEVIAEFDNWRKLRDIMTNETGWVQDVMLSGKRSIVIQSNNKTYLYKKPNDGAVKIAVVEDGALGMVKTCNKEWCKVKFPENYEGWVNRHTIRGIYPAEEFH